MRLILCALPICLPILMTFSFLSPGRADPSPRSTKNKDSRALFTKRHHTSIVEQAVTLTVNNGTGGGSYPIGSLIRVSANRPPQGERFAGWTGDIVILANPFLAVTTAIVPPIPVTIAAEFAPLDARE